MSARARSAARPVTPVRASLAPARLPFADAAFDHLTFTYLLREGMTRNVHRAGTVFSIIVLLHAGNSAGGATINIRPGIVPLHGHRPDPLDSIAGSPLHLASAMPWRWPWRLAFTQRIELVAADGLVGTAGTELPGRCPNG
jgi:hypothetical protein